MSAAVRWLAAAWNRAWFSPVPAQVVGLMRLLLGALLVVDHLWLWPQLDFLFARDGPVPPSAAAGDLPWPRLTWMDAVDGPVALRLVWAGGLLVYLLFALGLGGRLMALLALAFQASLYHRDPFYQHGGDRVLRLATLYMATVPCSAALSLDAWRRARRGLPAIATVPAIAHRLIQLQLITIYVHSGFVKARGFTWEQGTALYYALSNGQYARAPGLLEPLLRSDLFLAASRLATWLVLGWEAGFLLLIAWRRTRPLAMAVGVLMHLGIFLTLNVGSFSLVMLWCYLAWVDPARLDRLIGRWRARLPGSRPAVTGG
ncbi:MAG: hypothetical protein D6798_14820 [Deltaproteobacteria bacterium]|nr:MAG: hypothetical protein D6798_14820 [Deltaproteobacteria bacterium]